MKLSAWPMREPARIVHLGFPARTFRARELGLRPGTIIRVTHRTLFGGTVVDVQGSRIALDRASVTAINVQPVA